jgi:hypothetical protein
VSAGVPASGRRAARRRRVDLGDAARVAPALELRGEPGVDDLERQLDGHLAGA